MPSAISMTLVWWMGSIALPLSQKLKQLIDPNNGFEYNIHDHNDTAHAYAYQCNSSWGDNGMKLHMYAPTVVEYVPGTSKFAASYLLKLISSVLNCQTNWCTYTLSCVAEEAYGLGPEDRAEYNRRWLLRWSIPCFLRAFGLMPAL